MREQGFRVVILSADKDLAQLIREGDMLWDYSRRRRHTYEKIPAWLGVRAEQVADWLALTGDSVDNIPGAPGIGIKTAALLINEFGDLETLLARAGEIKQPKRRETLIDNADQIRLSKQLVTLNHQMELDYDLDSLELKDPEPEALLDFLAQAFRDFLRVAAQRGA